ncbi:hypothetical protein WJX84_004950 [Apatococcus fuscideae]|uniref:Lumazine-binding domain-containing protein n=1 Tax=Apatococcus fuscideae TaxID=2026836 RepID=A0AAW1RHM6_9CHLO
MLLNQQYQASQSSRSNYSTSALTWSRPALRPRARWSAQRSPTALFTGIVQGQAEVKAVKRRAEFSQLTVGFPNGSLKGIQHGASISINGTCLTVTGSTETDAYFDVIAETLRLTNLGSLQEGSAVNFERSARIGDEIGGHNVSGHIYTTGQITEITRTDDNRRIAIKVPSQWMKYILPKSYIAVDGISLTVGETGGDWFCIYLIPETLAITTMGKRQEGDVLNLEIEAQTQAIVDTVERTLERMMAERGTFVKP